MPNPMALNFKLASEAEIRQELCKRLRNSRLQQDLSQAQLALHAGISLSTLKRMESSGEASLETFVRAIQSLGLSGELEGLFRIRPQSIAQMERAAQKSQRQRAPRQKRKDETS